MGNIRSPSSRKSLTPPAALTAPLVFVVDDDISVRESLKVLIGCGGWEVETYESARAFLARPRVETASCLVLDVHMPDLNGLELQKRIALDSADIPIIFITGFGSVPMTVKAMRAGAMEVLTKPVSDEVLLDAISTAIARSQLTLTRDVALRALKDAYATLSRREREVMSLVVAGNLNKQTGRRLGICEITVKTHRGKLMRKMRATSLAELVTMAGRLGLTTANTL